MPSPIQPMSDAMARLAARSPRLAGALLVAVAGLLAAVNYGMILWRARFSGSLCLLAGACALLGVWVIITGRTGGRGGPKAPRWWTIGSVVFAVIGMGIGLYVSETLKR